MYTTAVSYTHLDVYKRQLQYLKEKKQDFVTDSTNLEDDALRNKIRHHVVPLLESINPVSYTHLDVYKRQQYAK